MITFKSNFVNDIMRFVLLNLIVMSLVALNACKENDDESSDFENEEESDAMSSGVNDAIRSACDESCSKPVAFDAETLLRLNIWSDNIYNQFISDKSLQKSQTNKSYKMCGNERTNDIEVYMGDPNAKLNDWDGTAYNGDIDVYYYLHKNLDLDLSFMKKDGSPFKEDGLLYVKLSNVNSGKVFNKNTYLLYSKGCNYISTTINLDEFAIGDESEEYAEYKHNEREIGVTTKNGTDFTDMQIKHYKDSEGRPILFKLQHGVMNICPLLITENGGRYYTHPIHIRTKPLHKFNDFAPKNIDAYGEVYGTVDGVRVICDGIGNKNDDKDENYQVYQCVELTKRYVETMYGTKWTIGYASDWYKKMQGSADYKVVNNKEDIRTGDVVSLPGDPKYGHIGVVSYVDYKEKKIYCATQNASGYDPILQDYTEKITEAIRPKPKGLTSYKDKIDEINKLFKEGLKEINATLIGADGKTISVTANARHRILSTSNSFVYVIIPNTIVSLTNDKNDVYIDNSKILYSPGGISLNTSFLPIGTYMISISVQDKEADMSISKGTLSKSDITSSDNTLKFTIEIYDDKQEEGNDTPSNPHNTQKPKIKSYTVNGKSVYNGYSIPVEEDMKLNVIVDEQCSISVYVDGTLIDNKTGKDVTIKIPTSEVKTNCNVTIKASSNATNLDADDVVFTYSVVPKRIPNSSGTKYINFNDIAYELKPNTEGDIVVEYRGKGIYRVSKSDGKNFATGGMFYMYGGNLFNSGNVMSDLFMPYDFKEKNGGEYYDLVDPSKTSNSGGYLIELHGSGEGFWIKL